MDGTARYSELLAKLGKHTTTGYCLYIKRLGDVELPILEQIVQKSYKNIKSQDGILTKYYGKLKIGSSVYVLPRLKCAV